jgi:hypothetical protein
MKRICDTCQRIMAFLYAEMWNELIFLGFGKCLSIIGCKNAVKYAGKYPQ